MRENKRRGKGLQLTNVSDLVIYASKEDVDAVLREVMHHIRMMLVQRALLTLIINLA